MKSTYIICLCGRFHALAADLFLENIQDLESGKTRSGIRTAEDRDRAILEITRPLSWRDALDLARRSGKYIGQLIPADNHIVPVPDPYLPGTN